MPMIEREDVCDSVPLREHDDRGIGQADVEVVVSGQDRTSCGDILGSEFFEPICATRYLLQ